MAKENTKAKKEQVDQQIPEINYANDPQTGKEEKGMSYDVKFSSFPSEGSVKGVCSVTFGGEIAVKGVKVIEGSKGLFVAMPSYKAGDEYKDIVYPITKEGRLKLNEAVIGEYQAQVQAHQEAFVQSSEIGFDMVSAAETPISGQAPAMQ